MKHAFCTLNFVAFLTSAALPMAATRSPAAQNEPITAMWKPVQVDFSYLGQTTLYSCDALEWKLEQVLRAIGAHAKTRVQATGCFSDGPSRHASVRVSGGVLVPATRENRQPAVEAASTQELIRRLGGKAELQAGEFQSVRKILDLSRLPAAGLEPGDCELMEQLARDVLPKLGATVVQDETRCFPGNVPITTPKLVIEVLMKAPDADNRKDASANNAR